jgi:YbbR domain-containing protein
MKKNKGFWSIVFSDWAAKLLCLAAALLLFFFYRINKLEERYISVPLSVSMNEDYMPATQYPRSVRLSLRGESNDLFSIQEDDLRAYVDLSAIRAEGLTRASVQIEKKGNAVGIDPLEIKAEPAEIAVNMEKKVSRIVPITPSFRGYLEPGYELVSFDFTPSEVEIAGPAGAVARVSDISTDFIELAGRKGDFTVKSRLVKKDPLIVLSGADSVDFRAVVQKSLAVKSFEAVPITPTDLPEGLDLAEPLPQGSIRLQSSKADLRGFDLPSGALTVDLSAIKRAGIYTLPVTAHLPEDFALDSYSPTELTLTVVSKKGGQP